MRKHLIIGVAIPVFAAGAIAFVTPGMGAATATDWWSGRWDIGGEPPFIWRRVSDSNGKAALKNLHGRPCREPSDYFRGSYSAGGGKAAGCTLGGAKRLRGRYRDASRAGSFDQRIISRRPRAYQATVTTACSCVATTESALYRRFTGPGPAQSTVRGMPSYLVESALAWTRAAELAATARIVEALQ